MTAVIKYQMLFEQCCLAIKVAAKIEHKRLGAITEIYRAIF